MVQPPNKRDARTHPSVSPDARGQDARPINASQARLANITEIGSLVGHEFNNYLNGILLHLAVLEQEDAESCRPQLEAIRTLSKGAARLVKQWQQFVHLGRPHPEPVDLNQVVRDAAAGVHAPGHVSIRLNLQPDLPPASAASQDLRRLVDWLLASSAGVLSQHGQSAKSEMLVETEFASDNVVLRVQDSGPTIPEDLLATAFDPFVIAREGTPEPGLCICMALARRLRGNISVKNRPERGVVLLLELPLVKKEAAV